MQAGYKVAVPVCDDDGVDLIVNYRTTVQVKKMRPNGTAGGFKVKLMDRRARLQTVYRADVFALYAEPLDSWWLIPSQVLNDLRGFRYELTLSPDPQKRSKNAPLSAWRDAWSVFEGFPDG